MADSSNLWNGVLGSLSAIGTQAATRALSLVDEEPRRADEPASTAPAPKKDNPQQASPWSNPFVMVASIAAGVLVLFKLIK